MNKKGFTLVELLAIITILALIAVLVFQEFSKQIKISKQQAYDRQITTIISSAKDYHLRNINEEGVTLQALENDGLINTEDIRDPRDNSIIKGCILFETDSYGQIDYVYKNSLTDCQENFLVNGYIGKNLVLHFDAKNNGGYKIKNNGNVWVDLSGNSNNGTLLNFGTTTTSGWQTDSLAFDGTDDGVFLENKLSQIFNNDSTLEITIKFNDSTEAILFGNYNVTNSINLERTTANKFRIYWNNGSPDLYGTYSSINNTKYTLSFVNEKNSKTIKLYINGTLNQTFTNDNFAQNTFDWNSAYIGRDSRTSETVLNGNIYSIRIYNKSLTEKQISDNYQIDKIMYNM